MKTFFLFVVAFVLSMLAGSTVVVAVAEKVRADETFIIAFFMLALVSFVAIAVFAIAYLAGRAARHLDWAGGGMALLYLGLMAALVVFEMADARGRPMPSSKGLVLIAAMAGSGLLTVLVQWWLIRRRFVKAGRAIA
jgi:hypothetical protein